jgi:hypothetical protein
MVTQLLFFEPAQREILADPYFAKPVTNLIALHRKFFGKKEKKGTKNIRHVLAVNKLLILLRNQQL